MVKGQRKYTPSNMTTTSQTFLHLHLPFEIPAIQLHAMNHVSCEVGISHNKVYPIIKRNIAIDRLHPLNEVNIVILLF
jgi:hypothetical protein